MDDMKKSEILDVLHKCFSLLVQHSILLCSAETKAIIADAKVDYIELVRNDLETLRLYTNDLKKACDCFIDNDTIYYNNYIKKIDSLARELIDAVGELKTIFREAEKLNEVMTCYYTIVNNIRIVKECINDSGNYDNNNDYTLYLPRELNTERARKYFPRAIKEGFIKVAPSGYKWFFGGVRGSKARLGYFIERVYCPTKTEKIPELAINRLFNVNRITSAITQLYEAKNPQPWKTEIDSKIFFD